ncbi:MAG: hypothetical protein AAGF12_07035 [Myxococcota bacterium]
MVRLVLIPWLVLSFGCEGCGGSETPVETETPEPSAESSEYGTITGVVRLAEGVELPTYPPVERADRPVVEACPPPQRGDRNPVTLLEDRRLAGLMVAASEFEGAAPPHDPVDHELRIEDCRLTPKTVVATRGDTLTITNGDEYPFMPGLRRGAIMQALPQNDSRTFELPQGGVQRVECGFSAPCNRADVIILYHPVHTLTGDEGRFRLERVPPLPLEIHAWHPLFEEAVLEVEVEAGETKEVELTIRPAATAVPNESEPAAEETDSPVTVQ